MSPITLTSNMSASLLRAQSQTVAGSSAPSGESPMLAAIRDFNYQGWASLATNQVVATARYSTSGTSGTTYNIGDTRTFNYTDDTPRTTTLEQTMTTSDGTTINLPKTPSQ
jgi:hypothetical protein